jgi:hypothetical protein
MRSLDVKGASPTLLGLLLATSSVVTASSAEAAPPSPQPAIAQPAVDASGTAKQASGDAPESEDNDETEDDGSVWDWLGFYVAASGAIDNGALAFAASTRFAVTKAFVLGLDGEYNPWFSLDGRRFARGCFNGFGTFIFRYPMTDKISLRTSLHVGASVLLMDLVGVPKGSTGPYLGMSILGISYELTDLITIVFDPADVSLPAPKVTGAPFVYRQYRFTLGFQFGA